MRASARVCSLVLFLLLVSVPATAQDPLNRPLRVYLDCSGFFCDQDFFTEEIPWVRFVRDRQVADVHVLGTRQTTGAGGSVYTLEFRGRDAFADQTITLQTSTPPDATESERRDELLRVARLGLAPFAAGTSEAPAAEFTVAAEQAEAVGDPEDDPWNRWVFQVGVNGFGNGESQQQFMNLSANTSASRVTEEWIVRLGVGGNLNRQEFESEQITDQFQTESYYGNAMLVKSRGPHWGLGTMAEWRRSTFNNYEHSATIRPAVEYNVFPYSESNRRMLVITYAIGPSYNLYEDSTIFAETEELLLQHGLAVGYDVTQAWGNIDVSADIDHYFTKFSDGMEWEEPQYNANLSGSLNLRLIRGLSFRVGGGVSMIRGQIQLRAGGLTEEEILTRQRELATNYRYFLSFGVSYRFGSIFSSVVNPRFSETF